jgi:lysophospholipase L1-like esterase
VIAEGEALGNELAPETIAAFDNDPNIQETYFFDGGHPDAAGYPIVAERVYRKLQELRWLSRPAS